MKAVLIIGLLSLAYLATLSDSKRIIDPTLRRSSPLKPAPRIGTPLQQRDSAAAQDRLMAQPHQPPNIALPPDNEDTGSNPPSSGGDNALSIFDVLGRTRSVNIFASFTRDVASVATRLESQDETSTLLAPLNSAVQALPRKPWEDPEDYEKMGETAYDGKSGEDRAARNLRRFVEAHVILQSPWKAGVKAKSLDGGELWWEEKDGKAFVSSHFDYGAMILAGLILTI